MMKKLLILICLFTSATGKAQIPSIGEIYNFSAGDTFLYKLTDLNSNQTIMYVQRAVLSRDDSHYPDSLLYEIEEAFLDTNAQNPVIWDTVTKVYYNCGDTIFPYNGFISCEEATDSCHQTSAIDITTDSHFPGLTVYHAEFDCMWWSYGWNNAATGLGIVHAYNGCGDFVLEQYDILLVDWVKEPAGVSEFDPGQLNVFPNPAGASVTIELPREPENQKLILSIFNSQAQHIASCALDKQKTAIDISRFSPGIYYYHLFSQNLQLKASGKICKQ